MTKLVASCPHEFVYVEFRHVLPKINPWDIKASTESVQAGGPFVQQKRGYPTLCSTADMYMSLYVIASVMGGTQT